MALGSQHALLCIVVLTVLSCGCTSSSSQQASEENSATAECHEPENPYDEGSGHYAGFQWAEEHDPASCGGNSQSFIEGCEEYQEQQSAYEECESKRK